MKNTCLLLCLAFVLGFCVNVAWAGPDDIRPLPASLSPQVEPVGLSTLTDTLLADLPRRAFVPQGTQLLDLWSKDGVLHATFSEEAAYLADHPAQSDDFNAYLIGLAQGYSGVRVYVQRSATESVPLHELQERSFKDWDTNPPLPGGGISRSERGSWPFDGPLNGKVIVTSPGHGYTFDSALGEWTTQRGLTNGLIEDISNANVVDRHLIPHLERLGARVFNARERDENLNEVIVDDADGAPDYTDESPFYESTSDSYGTHYRPCPVTADESESVYAKFTPEFPESGYYGVYVFYRAGTNRATDARHVIHHAGGENVVLVDQQVNDRRWVFLGTYYFEQGRSEDQGLLAFQL